MTQHELEIATMALDELLDADRKGIDHMHDAYWGAKMLLEEMGASIEMIGKYHVLLQDGA